MSRKTKYIAIDLKYVTCIAYYYMARAFKYFYITRAVIGQYSGPDFPVIPTGIMNLMPGW